MYVVIFKANILQLDAEYFSLAKQLREKALTQFNCQKFEALTENNQEIALSYWLSLQDIQNWKNDAEHLIAQQLGLNKWYQSISVEICKIEKSYNKDNLEG